PGRSVRPLREDRRRAPAAVGAAPAPGGMASAGLPNQVGMHSLERFPARRRAAAAVRGDGRGAIRTQGPAVGGSASNPGGLPPRPTALKAKRMNKIVVLGANSFSGQDFVDLLLDEPSYRVIGVSRSAERSGLFLRYKARKDLSRYRYHALDLNQDMPALLG